MIAIGGPGPSPWLYDDHLKLAGVKLYMDGALGSRGALLKAPYADRPKESGLAMLTSAQLKNKMSRAAMDGFQIAVHAIGDKGNDEVLSAIEELQATYKGDRRWRIEHAQIVCTALMPGSPCSLPGQGSRSARMFPWNHPIPLPDWALR